MVMEDSAEASTALRAISARSSADCSPSRSRGERPGTVGLAYTKRRWAGEEPARCRECGDEYAPATQVADLRRVLPEVGFDYDIPPEQGGGSYQEICPRCRRRLLALAQSARVRGFG